MSGQLDRYAVHEVLADFTTFFSLVSGKCHSKREETYGLCYSRNQLSNLLQSAGMQRGVLQDGLKGILDEALNELNVKFRRHGSF